DIVAGIDQVVEGAGVDSDRWSGVAARSGACSFRGRAVTTCGGQFRLLKPAVVGGGVFLGCKDSQRRLGERVPAVQIGGAVHIGRLVGGGERAEVIDVVAGGQPQGAVGQQQAVVGDHHRQPRVWVGLLLHRQTGQRLGETVLFLLRVLVFLVVVGGCRAG